MWGLAWRPRTAAEGIGTRPKSSRAEASCMVVTGALGSSATNATKELDFALSCLNHSWHCAWDASQELSLAFTPQTGKLKRFFSVPIRDVSQVSRVAA